MLHEMLCGQLHFPVLQQQVLLEDQEDISRNSEQEEMEYILLNFLNPDEILVSVLFLHEQSSKSLVKSKLREVHHEQIRHLFQMLQDLVRGLLLPVV